MRRPLALLPALLAAALAALGLIAGAALAAGSPASTTTTTTTSTTPTSTTPTTTTPPKPPAPARARARLYLVGALTVHHAVVTVPGRAVKVQGFVSPYVADQVVVVRSYLGRRLLKTAHLRLKPSAGHRYGRFTETVRSPSAGIVRVKVTHKRTAQLRGFFAERAFAALSENVSFGARGTLVTLVQQRLAALHVYIPQTGVYDTQTGLALDAYHRLLGWGEGNQRIDPRTVNALLAGRGSFHVRYPRDGNHVEGDLTSQLIALIKGSRVYRIYPISSGKASTPTVLGRFRVYSRVPGYLPDGMYYSSFFYRGYAVHGYNPAPDYPASHGCMRLPIVDAISVFDWLNYGDWVDVYH